MRLLRGFWKLLVGIKDALVLLLLLIFFGGLFAALSAMPNPSANTSGALLVALDGSLVEQPAETEPFGALFGQGPMTREYRLRDVVRAIEGAAGDASVKAVVLDLDRFTGGSQAAIAAAAGAVDKVRMAGKPVLAFATGYADDGYQLAAHASEVWLDPLGGVMLAGPGGSRLYYKGLLDKLGVETKVYRVGQFKSAVEPFTRTDQSPEAREADQALADTLWARWQEEVARARSRARLTPYLARPEVALAAAGGDMARAAVAAGLIDRLGSRAEFAARVAKLAGADGEGSEGYKAVALDDWVAAHPVKTGGDAVGVLTIAGEIVDGEAGPGTAAGDTIADLLFDELQRNRIKALVVRVDSPGGSVTASERIRQAILQAKARKLPVVVSMGGLAASGGYWVSTPADMIFADPATITGSIGVFGLLPTFKGTLAKLGLSADGVRTTPLSGEPDLFAGTSPTFDRIAQTGVESAYARFVGLVAESRRMPPARVDQIGQGRVWAGATARQLGLVDRFGGLDDAIAEAARRANVDPQKATVRDIEKEPSLFAQLFADYAKRRAARAAAQDAVTRLARRREAEVAAGLAGLARMADGAVVQARCLECPVTATAGLRLDWRTLVAVRLGLR